MRPRTESVGFKGMCFITAVGVVWGVFLGGLILWLDGDLGKAFDLINNL